MTDGTGLGSLLLDPSFSTPTFQRAQGPWLSDQHCTQPQPASPAAAADLAEPAGEQNPRNTNFKNRSYHRLCAGQGVD